MKKLFIPCFIFFIFINNIQAQSYNAMLGDSTKWSVARGVVDGGVYSNWMCIKDDTFTYGFTYKKFYADINTWNFYISDQVLFREDTANKKVYIRYGQAINKEAVVYDFELSVGQTVSLPFFKQNDSTPSFYTYIVDSVSSINTLAGIRKAIYLQDTMQNSYFFYKLKWIEGIGSVTQYSIQSIMASSPIYFSESSAGLYQISTICNEKNGVLQYHETEIMNDSTCTPSGGGGINSLQENTVAHIKPNPAFNQFVISKINNEMLHFQLYNLIGQKILAMPLPNKETIVPRNNILNGCYLFSLTNQAGKVLQSGKIILE